MSNQKLEYHQRTNDYKTSISSWVGILSLMVLLINDHILKKMMPGLVTGKLSDFAGIYLLSSYFEFVFLKGFRLRVDISIYSAAILSAVIFWALECWDDFIGLYMDLHNHVYSIFGINKQSQLTADITDLYALLMLPLYLYLARRRLMGLPHKLR